MIEIVKNILNTILDNVTKGDNSIEFESYLQHSYIENNKEVKIYAISYKSKDIKFIIIPNFYKLNAVSIYRNGKHIKKIDCSYEDYLEILLLTTKLNKIYVNKVFQEFVNSFN